MPTYLKYRNELITPVPSISYDTELSLNNDIIVGYQYNISLNGVLVNANSNTAIQQMTDLKNIFSSNGGALTLYNNNTILLIANEVKILSIEFLPSNDNWSQSIPYKISLQSNHMYLGKNLETNFQNNIENTAITPALHFPNIVNVISHKIKSFSENLNIEMNDSEINKITAIPTNNIITNSYFNITYTLSAIGKHDLSDSKTTLPAWEHAKRYVHTHMKRYFQNLMNNIVDNVDIYGNPSFKIFNETYNVNTSESEGSFEVQFSCLVKERCPIIFTQVGCSDNCLHSVSKKVNRSFKANEETNTFNQEISITVEGEIQGLIPGGDGRIIVENIPPTVGTFLIHTNSLIDKNDSADELLGSIYSRNSADLSDAFKTVLGITHNNLAINPMTKILPSKSTVTRNYLNGTINYALEYNNSFNCPTNHYEVTISVDKPTPIIAEFTIPNNNLVNGVPIPANPILGLGYSYIQRLNTQTAKKINVNINGTIGNAASRCCIGGSESNSNLFSYTDFISLPNFIIPSGAIIPNIGDNYVITRREKKITFPKGDFNLTLEYICVGPNSVCPITYLSE